MRQRAEDSQHDGKAEAAQEEVGRQREDRPRGAQPPQIDDGDKQNRAKIKRQPDRDQHGHRGGDGVIRRLEFLRPLRVSILSERRGPYAPFGLGGGDPGARGQNTLQRSGSQIVEDLGGKVQITVAAGDILTIATPGGGAFVVRS